MLSIVVLKPGYNMTVKFIFPKYFLFFTRQDIYFDPNTTNTADYIYNE
jgi:hypothetical protein